MWLAVELDFCLQKHHLIEQQQTKYKDVEGKHQGVICLSTANAYIFVSNANILLDMHNILEESIF